MRLRGVRLVDLSSADSGPSKPPAGAVVDIRIDGGRIAEISPGRRWSGTWVMPGLWDHHVHMSEWARTAHRLDLSHTRGPTEALAAVAEAAAAHDSGRDGPHLVGIRLWHSRWPAPLGSAGAPSLADLDAVTGDLPTVLISADLHSAWLNSAALATYATPADRDGEAGRTGVVAEDGWFGIMPRLAAEDDSRSDAWVAGTAEAAASRGVVGIVDFEFQDTLEAWRRRISNGFASLRVRAALWPEHLESAIAAGLRTGGRGLDPGDDPFGLLRVGPLKIISDGSLNTRTAWCHDPYPDGSFGAPNLGEAQLRSLMARAHGAGFHCAIHAIGDRANTTALDAFAATGVMGSIEHAQLLAAGDAPRFADLGVRASVQPVHLLDDRDTAERLWAGRTGAAFAFADLERSGADVRFGSDAPVAPLDPWLAVSAASTRTGDERPPWHGEQLLARSSALRASTAGGRVEVGAPADLVVLGDDPLTARDDALRRMPVVQTICGGAITHES